MRIKLTLSYNGSRFSGSQSQTETGNTVMGVLHQALTRLGISAKPVASGRTDAGVHAFRQVVHIDLPPHWSDLVKLRRALSHQLPASIAIRRLEAAEDDFHARFSAHRRVYRYIMSDREPNPFEAELVTFVAAPLDLDRINEAMHRFEGEHDFEFFKKTGSDVKHYVRTVYKAFAYRHRGYTILYFEANGYLRSQIRMMADAVLKVNSGEMRLPQLQEQIDLKARHSTDLAPAAGLYLSKIIY
ncbi:tRNA pseudouridine(38-40) synthase TruA [Sulfurimonas sp. HSL-1656]|uniref:tRNA pseudouridine(38-40) synthase TruA n=1 Tax=Thiomicrolovo subterrani TaxID=3131934 RepID=UPI0031F9BCEF